MQELSSDEVENFENESDCHFHNDYFHTTAIEDNNFLRYSNLL